MIDITKIVTTYNAADLQAYINDYMMGDLQFKQFFPSQYTPKLTFESLQADFGAKVAADVVAFDSRAPRKGRPLPGKVTGDIPKIEIARVKKESDLNTYRMLQDAVARATNVGTAAQIKNRLIEWIYGDTSFVLDGVNARIEWLSKRLASTGEYVLTLVNNEAGVVTKVPVNFGIPSGNITSVGTDWDTTNSANPITDITAKQTAARLKGLVLRYAITDQATFNRMVATDAMQKFAASFANNALSLQVTPNLATVNTALTNAGLPAFIIWDSYVNLESKAGVYTATSGWEDGNILMSASNQMGDVQWTTTADAFVTIDDSVKASNDFTLIKAFAEQDPITVITKGVAYATPVLNNASQLYILKTQL